MDGERRLRAGFDRDCHALLNAVVAAITRELSDRAGIELPPATGKSQSGNEIKLSIVYQGPADEAAREAAREVLQRSGNAAEMVRLLKRVGLG